MLDIKRRLCFQLAQEPDQPNHLQHEVLHPLEHYCECHLHRYTQYRRRLFEHCTDSIREELQETADTAAAIHSIEEHRSQSVHCGM